MCVMSVTSMTPTKDQSTRPIHETLKIDQYKKPTKETYEHVRHERYCTGCVLIKVLLVLQCVVVFCSVMQCVAVDVSFKVLHVLQCVAVCCSVMQCVAVDVSFKVLLVLQCVAVCCSVLQCVAVCCS